MLRSSPRSSHGMRALTAPLLAVLVLLVALCAPGAAGAAAPAGIASPVRDTPVPGPALRGQGRAVVIVGRTAYVGGWFDRVRTPDGTWRYRSNLVAIDIDTGDVRTDFRADTNGMVRALATDGQVLYAGGSFTLVNGSPARRIVALDLASGGVLGRFWAPADADVVDIALSGPRLYVVGRFTSVNGRSRAGVAALRATSGAVISGWAPQPDDVTRAVAVSPDGATVYIGGSFTHVDGHGRDMLAALRRSDGSVRSTYYDGVDGDVLAIDATAGQVFAGVGSEANMVGSWGARSGELQWGDWLDGDVQAVVQADGIVWFGFHDGMDGDGTLKLLGADASDGELLDWWPTFNAFLGVFGIAVNGDTLVATGRFSRVSGVDAGSVALFPFR